MYDTVNPQNIGIECNEVEPQDEDWKDLNVKEAETRFMKFYRGAIKRINSDIKIIETGNLQHKELLDHLDPNV